MNTLTLVPIPFEYSRFIQISSFVREYFDIKFNEDFGVFKEGESYESADIDLVKGELKVYNGRIPIGMQEIALSLVPINI